MIIKVKYLNWDKNLNWDKDEKCHEMLKHFMLGGYTGNINDYRDINTYYLDDSKYIGYESILDEVFQQHNRIDDETFCRLKDDQRSMCVGDLIYIDKAVYCVNMFGFGEIDINNSII